MKEKETRYDMKGNKEKITLTATTPVTIMILIFHINQEIQRYGPDSSTWLLDTCLNNEGRKDDNDEDDND